MYKQKRTIISLRSWSSLSVAWQRPTLPGPCGPSTIGAGGLNGRVRDGYVWNPSAIATKHEFASQILIQVSASPNAVCSLVQPKLLELTLYQTYTLKTGSETLLRPIFRISPRPISIGQLHALLHFHPQPIYLVVFKGSY